MSDRPRPSNRRSDRLGKIVSGLRFPGAIELLLNGAELESRPQRRKRRMAGIGCDSIVAQSHHDWVIRSPSRHGCGYQSSIVLRLIRDEGPIFASVSNGMRRPTRIAGACARSSQCLVDSLSISMHLQYQFSRGLGWTRGRSSSVGLSAQRQHVCSPEYAGGMRGPLRLHGTG
jgi:hypothetical protein